MTVPTRQRPKRRPHRREQILSAALSLFHARGFHATGMDDIGAAAGITGPGVYRHFRSKEEILEVLVTDRGTSILAESQEIVDAAETAQAAFEALIRHYARSIVANPSLAVVAMYERRTLSPDTRAALDRMERRNTEAWVRVLMDVRPELPPAEARAMVNAALAMGVAVCNYKSGLDDESLAALVESMVRSSLAG